LMQIVQETSLAKIAAMRNRSLTIASLASDASIQMLTLVMEKLTSMEASEMRPQDIAPMVKASSTVASDAVRLADQALALTELIAMIDEMEQLELEQLQIIEAEKIN